MLDTTRDRIVEAALYLAQNNGIDFLSMETVADAADVSRKTMYNYFANKYDLADEVATVWISQTLEHLTGIAENREMDFVSKINLILSQSFDRLQTGSRMMQARAKPQTDIRVSRMKRELRERLRQFIQDIVREAQDSGLVLPDFETGRLAWIVINIVEGILIIDEFEELPISKTDLLRDSLKAVVRGILSPKGSEALRTSPIYASEGGLA